MMVVVRLVVGLMLPPLLGASLIVLAMLATPTSNECSSQIGGCSFQWSTYGSSVIGAYLIMGIPALIYSLLMEFLAVKVLRERGGGKGPFVAVSIALGCLAGSIGGVFTPLTFVGAVVGLITGLFLLILHPSRTLTDE